MQKDVVLVITMEHPECIIKLKKPFGKETNYLLLMSSGVVYSSFLNIYQNRN